MSNIKHIFFVEKLDYRSGWGTLTLNFLKNFNAEDVLVLCKIKNNNYDYRQEEILSSPLKYFYNPILLIIDTIKINIFLKRKYSKQEFFAHFTVEPYCLLFSIFNPFKKNIFYAIGTYSIMLSKKFIFKNFFINKISKILYFSSYTKKKVNQKINLDRIENEIINPIIYPRNLFIKNKKEQNKYELVSVGMFKKRKGFINLIEVMNIIVNKNNIKNIILTIVGDNTDKRYFNEVISLTNQYQLSGFVFFETCVNDDKLSEIYKRADLFILLSEDHGDNIEGFGIVYLEAMSYDLPIIVSNQTGAIDLKLIDNQINICSPYNYKLAASIIQKSLTELTPNLNIKILKKYLNYNQKKLDLFYKL